MARDTEYKCTLVYLGGYSGKLCTIQSHPTDMRLIILLFILGISCSTKKNYTDNEKIEIKLKQFVTWYSNNSPRGLNTASLDTSDKIQNQKTGNLKTTDKLETLLDFPTARQPGEILANAFGTCHCSNSAHIQSNGKSQTNPP